MKYVTRSLFAFFGFLTVLNTPFSNASAQGTAFTYQGRLNNNGAPASGTYNFQFTLYASSTGDGVGAPPITNSAVLVTNGLFTTLIDFGPGVFTGNSYWLDIAVSTNGSSTFTELSPRQPITPTPYAIMANTASNLLGALPASQLMGTIPATNLSGTIPSANFSGPYGNQVSFGNGADSFDGDFFGQFFGSLFQGGTFTGQFLGDGSGIININPAHINGEIAFLNSNQTFTAQNVFMQPIGLANPNPSPNEQIDALAAQSNVRMVSTNTLFGAVLELKNLSSYGPEYIGAINFNNTNNYYPGQIGYIAENPTNEFLDYMEFRVGGTVGLTIQADPRGAQAANIIGGYPGNNIPSAASGSDVIVGGGYPGAANTVLSNSYGVFIGAGSGNQIGPNVNDSVISGGYFNIIQSYDSVIGGGVGNFILSGGQYVVIGGGNGNEIQTNVLDSVIGGGVGNNIHGADSDSFIGSGYDNTLGATNSADVIGGGYLNLIDAYNNGATIGGGFFNRISSSYLYYTNDYITGSFIGGGYNNLIDTNGYVDTVTGGQGETIQSNAVYAFIGGGADNTVLAYANGAVIGGGENNQAGGGFSTVPGGLQNSATGQGSFAAGNHAQAVNDGAFVLADNEFVNFSSTSNNQLSVRFTGGIVFVTGGAGMTLDGQPVLAGNNGANLANVNASTLNGFSSSSFAPVSGSGNYIQNQSSSPQTASLNINGNAAVGGTVSAGSATVTNNATVGGTISANSLTITNQFRVAGAGIGTSTPAFIQVATVTNSSGDSTYINSPLCNGDPNAILIVTHNYDPPGASTVVYNKVVGVWYNLGQWAIYNEDLSNMQTNPGVSFNVLVIKH
ncbi:MAG TPA: hypothetical protein VGN23_15680 [Verrucomicrobiae bacterium]|jgi:hypothetical protein